MSEPIDLWELAKEELKKQTQPSRRAILLGPKAAGKSSLLRLLRGESDEGLRPTTILDFTYFKGMSRHASLVDCYDLEGGLSFKELLPSLLTKDSFRETTIVLVVDLSKPKQLAAVTRQWLEVIREGVASFFERKLESA